MTYRTETVSVPLDVNMMDGTTDTLPIKQSWQCKDFWCRRCDIESVQQRSSWINGRVITVFAESVDHECGQTLCTDHLPPLIFLSVREYEEAREWGN
jgi:hypothetical protein